MAVEIGTLSQAWHAIVQKVTESSRVNIIFQGPLAMARWNQKYNQSSLLPLSLLDHASLSHLYLLYYSS